MNLVVYNIKDVLVFFFSGTFSESESNLLSQRFQNEIKSFKHIVFDLTELTYIDTTGIGEMIHCLKIANENNIILKLVGIQNSVKIVFDIKRASKIFDIYPCLEESLSSFG